MSLPQPARCSADRDPGLVHHGNPRPACAGNQCAESLERAPTQSERRVLGGDVRQMKTACPVASVTELAHPEAKPAQAPGAAGRMPQGRCVMLDSARPTGAGSAQPFMALPARVAPP